MRFYGYDLDPSRLPKHIGIIMDGNGRWAARKGLERAAGHERGFKTLKRLMDFNRHVQIKTLTVFAFSTENWNRPKQEVDFLMALMRSVISEYTKELLANDIRLAVTGSREGVPVDLNRLIDESLEKTSGCKSYVFNVAFNYGGRREIVDAAKAIARDVRDGKLNERDVDEATVGRHLYSPGLPDADLIIRTSGELRFSNFLLWQSAYAELWFTRKLWPDFHPRDYCKAIYDFQNRHRRFGNV